MLKTILTFVGLIMVFGAISTYAGEKEQTGAHISITLEDRKALIPDLLVMNLQIKVNTATEAEAINMLGSVDKAIRELKVDYTGGKYSVNKHCWWEWEKRRCAGYEGGINYVFQLREPKEQNKILEVVDSFKDKYEKKMNYSVSEPSWIVSGERIKAIEEELRYSIIDSAKSFAKRVSEKLEKNCSIQSIRYDIDRSRWGWWEIGLKSIEAPEPKKEDQIVKVQAKVELKCE